MLVRYGNGEDDVLYLFYASVKGKEETQTVSVAYSTDGIHFEKYKGNPVIEHYPNDGGPDFRDPAVCYIDGQYYCVMATGNPESKTGRLLLYKSDDLFHWEYEGIMCEWKAVSIRSARHLCRRKRPISTHSIGLPD